MIETNWPELLPFSSHPRQTAILAGAGISLNPPSSLPPAWPLMRTIIEALAPDDISKQKLLAACDANRADKLIEQNFLRMERLFDLVYPKDTLPAAIMEMSKADHCNNIHFALASAAAAGTIILTTNFDCLIEKACAQLGYAYKVLVLDEDYLDFDTYRKQNICLILKLHGSANVPQSIQTTLRHIGKGMTDWHFTKTKGMALRSILQSCHLAVIGYSGSDDFDIVPVLTQTPSDKYLLWVEHDENRGTGQSLLEQSRDMDQDMKSTKLLANLAESTSLRPNEMILKLLIRTTDFCNRLWPHKFESKGHESDVGTRVQNILNKDAKQRYSDVIQQWHDASMLFSELQNKPEAIRCAHEGRQLAVSSEDEIGVAVVSAQLGTYYAHAQDYANAEKYLNEAESIAKKRHILSTLSIIYSAQSYMYDKIGDREKEIICIRKAIALDRELENMTWLAGDLSRLATILSDHDPDEAFRLHRQALEIARTEGDIDGELTYLNNGFLLFRGRMHPSEIVKDLKYAEDLAIKTGNIRALVEIYGNMGMVCDAQAEFQGAISFCEKAVAHANLIGLEEGEARWTSQVGDIYRKTGRYEKALEVLKSVLPVLEKYQSATSIGTAHGRLGLIYNETGDYQNAVHHLTKALEYDQRAGWTRGVVDDLGNLGLVFQNMGDYGEAMRYFQEAVNLARRTRYKEALARNLGNLGMELSRRNLHSDALHCDEEAMEINVEIGNREGEAWTRVNLAEDYFQAERFDDAIAQLKIALVAAQEMGLERLIQHIKRVLGQFGIT